jgi:hypothetical protein
VQEPRHGIQRLEAIESLVLLASDLVLEPLDIREALEKFHHLLVGAGSTVDQMILGILLKQLAAISDTRQVRSNRGNQVRAVSRHSNSPGVILIRCWNYKCRQVIGSGLG